MVILFEHAPVGLPTVPALGAWLQIFPTTIQQW